MRLDFQSKYKSIGESVSDSDINDFIVLTGPNGSGKSSLLEAISLGKITIQGIDSSVDGNIRLFSLSQFTHQSESMQTQSQYNAKWIAIKQRSDQLIESYVSSNPSYTKDNQYVVESVINMLSQEGHASREVLLDAQLQAKKPITLFEVDDYKDHLDLLNNRQSAFEVSLTDIFLQYNQKYLDNQFNEFRSHKQSDDQIKYLNETDFFSKYGTKPWVLLDEILNNIGLGRYTFKTPEYLSPGELYEPLLLNSVSGEYVSVNDLSSGEKTLLQVALTLYSTSENNSRNITLPSALLLDEADASLHPSMVQSLLDVLKRIVVGDYKVKVIMTTHSPTTVALAPEDSLYIMQPEGQFRLRKASNRDEALKYLTVGLPTLSVSVDDRIQVFVESTIDAHSYSTIYSMFKQKIESSHSLSFIASGDGQSGNRSAVVKTVKALQRNGNSTVKGLVDRDTSFQESTYEHVYLSTERYSLENFIFDPLIMAIFLYRGRIIKSDDIGLSASQTHMDVLANAQPAVDYICGMLQDGSDDLSAVEVVYSSGLRLSLPSWILNVRGHDLVERYFDKFQALKSNRNADSLLKRVIDESISDVPGAVPRSLITLFADIAD